MSPTVPTTTDSRDDEDNDDPSWIFRPSSLANARRHRVALSNFVPTPPVDQSTRRQQQQQQQQEDCEEREDRRLFDCISRDPQGERIADAYDGLVTVIGNKGEDEGNGDCWLMSHQSLSSAELKGTTSTSTGVVNQQDERQRQTIKTAEFWIHQLRSVLQETRSNLSLIVAFHQRQMQQQQTKQPATSTAVAEDPSRAIIRCSKSDVAVQTDSTTTLNNKASLREKATAAAAAHHVNDDDAKLNYYRKSVSITSRHDHHVVAGGGSLIEQMSPSSLPSRLPSAAAATLHNASSSVGVVGGKVLCLDSLADDDGCHFMETSNSCCALSSHSRCCCCCRFHSGSCCPAANKQILLSKASTLQEPAAYSSRINRTTTTTPSNKKVVISSGASGKLLEEDRQDKDRFQWANRCDNTAAILLLNEAWQLAGLHSRQRMSILSRHYRILYKRHRRLRRRHRRLRRSFQRTRRRHLYVQLQLQILLESIGTQVDDVASDWVDRLKGLLRLQAFTARDPTAADGLLGAPKGSSSSSPDDSSYSPFHSTGHQQPKQQQQQQQFNNKDNRYYSFSLYRWYSSLSLKLNWLQTSHRTVIENLLLFQRIPGTTCDL